MGARSLCATDASQQVASLTDHEQVATSGRHLAFAYAVAVVVAEAFDGGV